MATSGAISAAISTAAVYPLDTVKTYLNKGVDREGAALCGFQDVLTRVVFKQGMSCGDSLAVLYSGIRAKLVMSVTQKFLYFYIYNYFIRTAKRRGSSISILLNLVIGYLAAVAAVGLLTPIEVAQTQQQLSGRSESIFLILQKIFRAEGFAGFFKGICTNLILCVNPAIEYSTFEQLKKRQLSQRPESAHLTDSEAFLLGALAKAVATVTTFPHVRAKVLQQSSQRGDRFAGMNSSSILVGLLTTEGLPSLFAGMKTQLVKNVVSSALMLSLKERIERSVVEVVKGG